VAPQTFEIRIEQRDQVFNGHFYVGGNLLHVDSAYGSASVKLGKREPKVAAEKLFGEIIRKWRDR
jgi:hypothetical protein